LFKTPFHMETPATSLPDRFAYWASDGVLCRRLDGAYCVYDPIAGRRFSVDPAIAAAVHAEQPKALLP
jgi:hypothetical protein